MRNEKQKDDEHPLSPPVAMCCKTIQNLFVAGHFTFTKSRAHKQKKFDNFIRLPTIRTSDFFGLLAQLVEHRTLNPLVERSSRSQPTNKLKACRNAGLFYLLLVDL